MELIQFPKVCILLAYYKGESYITEQLLSILEQDYQGDIQILIRDDHPKELIKKIISSLEFNNSYRTISYYENSSSSKGHLENFSKLCDLALLTKANYFLFSDQDDYWHSNKVSTLLSGIREKEKQIGNHKPILVHSDLRVVDSSLNLIDPSLFRFQQLPDQTELHLPRFLIQNNVTGCASLFNRALLEVAAPIPKEAIVHDWWFGLCAHLTGEIEFKDVSLLDYRQHIANSIGAKSSREQRNIFKKYIYKNTLKFPAHIQNSIFQTSALLSRLNRVGGGTSLSLKHLEDFVNLSNLTWFGRLKLASFFFTSKSSFLEKLYFYLIFFIYPWLDNE